LGISKEEFFKELKDRELMVANVFNQERYQRYFRPEVLRQAVYLYLDRPAKRLRPGILFFCCSAVGGAEEQAVLAAAAVELYHTWTLVHDDIIDNDLKRRGLATVHEEFRIRALDWGYSEQEAADLGRNIAIITGDLQQAWSIRLFLDSTELGVPAPVIFDLVERLTTGVTCGLLEGETRDVLFSKYPIPDLAEQDVINMLELKTGVLYEFAAIAGASIGLAQTAKQNRLIQAVGRFARGCGLAFQLQDDVLGITGDQKLLGKPVGSDIRAGKRTTIVLHAFQNAGTEERQFLQEKLGNPAMTETDIAKIQNILIQYNGVEYTRKLAESFVSEAIQELSVVPESRFKDLLLTWAWYIVSREL
jgi:geranylgeranyl diphosphate synthase type I